MLDCYEHYYHDLNYLYQNILCECLSQPYQIYHFTALFHPRLKTYRRQMTPIEHLKSQLSETLARDAGFISPQLTKRITRLLEFDLISGNLTDFVSRFISFFNRFILELIQTHSNTKQRENDLVRLIKSKGCSVADPKLTDAVIFQLIKLQNAVDGCSDRYLERRVLTEFLYEELANLNPCKKEIGKILQTLYRCSCFDVITQEKTSGRMRIKLELNSFKRMRQKYDLELMRMASMHGIRLPSESWAFILYGTVYPRTVAKVQSIIDKCHEPIKVQELRKAIEKSGDWYGIKKYLDEFEDLEDRLDLLHKSISDSSITDADQILILLRRLAKYYDLFKIRQLRNLM